MISATGQIVIVTLGGVIGSSLTDNQSIATLPVSLMVVVTALSAIPATILMKKVGRRMGSSMASLSAASAVLIGAYALHIKSFEFFVLAAALFGINAAFSQQYRYAAAESVDQKFVSRAISMILLGAIGGAMLGPELVTRGRFWIESAPYAGSLISLSVLFGIQSILLMSLRTFSVQDDGDLEVIAANKSGMFFIFHHDGTNFNGFPLSLNQYIESSPVVSDLDEDGDYEVAVGTSLGLHVFDIKSQKGEMYNFYKKSQKYKIFYFERFYSVEDLIVKKST